MPSPCGPYSICRVVDDRPVCSCNIGYVGAPPTCRPECIVNSECSLDKACLHQKCVDPCPGTCGYNARCKVVNHNPICTCPADFVGDPFTQCVKSKVDLDCDSILACMLLFLEPIIDSNEVKNPCIPSPCGSFSDCRVLQNRAVCSCLPNYFGRPPNCRPECTVNSECSLNKACQNQRCIDPCPGSCGTNAECRVISHSPTCYCLKDYTGDPFSACSKSKRSTTNPNKMTIIF